MKKIDALTGARFFAIMLIVNTHFEFLLNLHGIGDFYGTFLKNATLGTNFFFMVSGFGMMLSFLKSGKEYNGISSGILYGLNHIKKIYPFYLFSILLCIPHFFMESIFVYGKGIGRTALLAIIRLLLDLVLGQSLTGVTSFSHSFNGVCWFLSTLFCIYLISPFLMSKLKKYIKSARIGRISLIIVLLIQFGLMILFDYIESKTFFDDLSYGSPYRRVLYVICGMILALCYYFGISASKESVEGKAAQRMRIIIELFLILALIIYYFSHNTLMGYSKYLVNILDFLSCIVFVVLLVDKKSILSFLFSRRTIVRLGDMSMYIFLFHYPLSLYLKLLIQLTGWNSIWFYILSCVLIIAVSIVIAWLLKTKTEKRVSKCFDTFLSKKKCSAK